MAIANLVRKFSESYLISKRIMHEINLRFPDFKPENCLDYGAGLGPSSLLMSDLFENCKIHAIEPNENMRNLGKYISKKKDNIDYFNNLFDSLVYQEKILFDTVFCSFVLEEIPTPEERIIVINSLWERVQKNGYMIYVLPGSPMGFRYLNDLREFFR